MKNFTNNFKQFTSRLSARWLIMALMLLLGTSGAWAATIYFDNTNTQWSNVYIYLYNGTYWDYNNGSGASNIKACGTMTPIGNNIYSYTYSGDYNQVVSFTSQNQCGYNNFSGNSVKVCYSDSRSGNGSAKYTNSKPLFIPDTSSSFNKNNNTATYYHGDWATEPQIDIDPCAQKYYLKHAGWSGSDWAWKELTNCNDGVYTLEATYNGSGCNYNTSANDSGAGWISLNNPSNVSSGTVCIFTFDPSVPSITITPKCTTPTFTISGSDQICEGTEGHSYSIINPAVASGVTYAWSNNLAGASSTSATGTTYTFNTSANGAKTGTITVTATNGTCTHTETKNISQIAKPTAGTLSITSANLKIGDTKTITVTGANGGTKSWSSDNTDVATVDANGKVTAKAAGTATITYTVQPSLNGCGSAATATATIKVCTTPTFTIDGLTSICEEGEYTYAIDDAVNPNATYAWTNGLLNNATSTGTSYTFTAGTGTKTGTISVVATDAACTYEQSIDVSQIAKVTTAGTITGTSSTIEVGKTSQLSVDGASTGTASWSSDPEDVATVNANGLVTAESAGTATITYTVEPSLTGCGSTQSTTYTITVIEACEAPIVTIKNVEQLSCSSLKVTYNVTSNNGQSCGYPTGNANKIRIFDSQANAEGTTLFIGSLLHTAAPINEDEEVTIPSNYMWTQPGGTYYVRVGAENSQGWGWSNIMEVTIPTNETLTNVTINPVDAVCKGQSTTLTLNNYSIGDIQWQKKVGDVWTNIAGATAVSYTTEALNAEMQYRIVLTDNNCNVHIQPITVSVTEPPVITSITGDDNVTIGDNVSLTANITGVYEEIEWAVEGVNSSEITTNGTSCSFVATDITTYVATATVKSASCTVSRSHNIVVNDEDCAPEPSNDIQITFTHPVKNNNNAACQYWGFGYIFKDGVTPNSNRDNYLAVFPNKDQTSGSKTVTLSNVQTAEIKVYLNAYHNYSECRASTQVFTLQRGGIYSITISSDQQGNGNWEKVPTVTKTGSLTRDPDITAPAVKMVSAEYNENTSQVDVVAAIYKRGCDNVEWGFQYSEDGTTWSNKIYPNSHTATAVGEVTHSFSIDGGEGNTYYIRAYAKNSNSEVTSANTKSVEIPSSIINSATISLVDSEGNELVDTEVCPQSTVYLKVAYVGGDFTDFVAEENFPGTDLELVNHYKTENYAIFSFTATAAGTANITISNKSGSTVTPANGVSITLEDVQVVTTPIIYLEKNTICENQNTNVVVNSPIVGFIYSLKNGSVGDPITYESGDLKFEVNKEGSYTVQVQETVCGTTAISAPVDLRVIASDVKITLTTDVNTINPWQPLTLTVKAPSGYDYDLQGLDGTVYTKSGDVYTIKFPRPDSWGVGNSASKSEPKTFTAGIKAGEEPSCSTTTKEIQLVDTEEVCLAPGN